MSQPAALRLLGTARAQRSGTPIFNYFVCELSDHRHWVRIHNIPQSMVSIAVGTGAGFSLLSGYVTNSVCGLMANHAPPALVPTAPQLCAQLQDPLPGPLFEAVVI